MRKLIKKTLSFMIVTFLAVFLGSNLVSAADKCTYQEKANLNEIAQNVKTSYEITERKEKKIVSHPDKDERVEVEYTYPEFKISIYNLTDDLYVMQTNELTKEVTYIYNNMTTNGVYTLIDPDLQNIVTYTYKVLSNLKACEGEALRTYTIKKPKENWFASLLACQGYADLPYCKPYITEELNNITESDLSRLIEDHLATETIDPNKNKDDQNNILTFFKNYWLYTLIGVVLVAGATGGTIYFVKKRSAL